MIDCLTGSRAATMAMLQGDRLIGMDAPPAMMSAPAGAMILLGATAQPGAAAIPRGAVRIRGGIWTAAQVAQWIEALAERSQVWAAMSRFQLDRNSAADLLAARAYVWARNMLPMNARYWNKVPMSGFFNDWVAEEVLRYERAHPGTAMAATQGDAAALRAIDEIVNRIAVATGAEDSPNVLERTSAVSSALSANGTRARTLLGIAGNQRWQAHHIIPFATVARLPAAAQQAIAASGWRMDSLVNLIALLTSLPSCSHRTSASIRITAALTFTTTRMSGSLCSRSPRPRRSLRRSPSTR